MIYGLLVVLMAATATVGRAEVDPPGLVKTLAAAALRAEGYRDTDQEPIDFLAVALRSCQDRRDVSF